MKRNNCYLDKGIHLNKTRVLLPLPTASFFAPTAPASGSHWPNQDCLDQFPTNLELSATYGHSRKKTINVGEKVSSSHPATNTKSNTAVFYSFVKFQNNFYESEFPILPHVQVTALLSYCVTAYLAWKILVLHESVAAARKRLFQTQLYLICALASENTFLWGEKTNPTFPWRKK